jgi:hypothetical protein
VFELAVHLAVLFPPLAIAGIVFFAKAPEAGRKFSVTVRVIVTFLTGLTIGAAILEQWENDARQRESIDSRNKLADELAKLRTVAPLRKEAADLATEVLNFYNDREHYTDRFTPGRALSESQAADVLKWYSTTVAKYHAQFEKRITSVLGQIRAVTGMDVSGLQADTTGVKFAPQVKKSQHG